MIFQDLPPEEQAYRDADEMTWRGKPLEPYSFLRRTAAIALVQYFGGNMPEAVLAVWLGLQPDVRVRLARRDPSAVEAEIDTWAERESVLVIRENESGAMCLLPDVETQTLYERIMSGIYAVTPKPSDDTQKKSDIAPETAPITSP